MARQDAGRRLPADHSVPTRQPAGQKLLLHECEVVHRQTQRFAHGGEAALGELHHDVDLQHLSLVVKRQGLEVRSGKAAPVAPLQPDRHGRAEHPQPLVEADHLQLVEPEQGPVQQFGRVPHRALQHQVGLDRLQELPQRGLGQEVGAPQPARQAVEQMSEQPAGRLAADAGDLLQRTPCAVQRDPRGLRVALADREAARGAVVLAAPVEGDPPDDAEQPFRQRIGQTLVPQHLRGDTQME